MTVRELKDRMQDQPREVREAAHAIGLDYKLPYTRHGKHIYKPFRNHFETGPECDGVEIWLDLEKRGCAYRLKGTWSFWLTRKGLDWLGEALKIHINSEE